MKMIQGQRRWNYPTALRAIPATVPTEDCGLTSGVTKKLSKIIEKST